MFREYPNVEVDTFDGLLVDYARRRRASAIVRGLRAVSDFEYEFQMALMNRHLEPTLETVFMMPAEQYTYLSSRLIKEVFSLGGDVRGLVPPVVERWMRRSEATAVAKQWTDGSGDQGRTEMGMFAQRLAQVSASATLKVAAEAERLRRAGLQRRRLQRRRAGLSDARARQGGGQGGHRRQLHALHARRRAFPSCARRSAPATRRDYGVDITPAEVLMTAGGKQALFNTALALFDPGDEVITHAPYWPTIPEQVKLVGAMPVIVQTSSERRLRGARRGDHRGDHAEDQGDHHQLAVQPDRRADRRGRRWRRSPRRPPQRGIWIIVDLCYEQLIYEPVPHNLPKVLFDRHRDRTVLAGSASKAYAMTGWRCGWTIAPKELTAAFNVIQGQSTSNITSITQKAALAAITGPQDAVTAMLDEYRDAARQHPRVADRAPGDQVRQAEGRVLPVPGHLGSAVAGRHDDVRRLRAGAAREGARRRDAGRGVRRAGLSAHLVRDVDGAAARGRRRASSASPRSLQPAKATLPLIADGRTSGPMPRARA